MAESRPIVTLITGPNRGIGRGMLSTLLQRPNNIVIGAVRKPEATVSQALHDLPRAEGTKLILVKIDSTVETDAAEAIEYLKQQGITYIDRVVSNAGIGEKTVPVLETAPQDVRNHMEVALYAPLALFQATEPLLRQSEDPKFISFTSGLTSMSLMEHMPGPWFCYGVAKVTQNYMVRKLHFEHDWLTSVAVNPGWAQTDMGATACLALGMPPDSAPVKLEDSVRGCLKVIDDASRTQYSGECISWDLTQLAW